DLIKAHTRSQARRRVFSNMLEMYQHKIDNAVAKAFNHYKSMKIKIRLHMTYDKLTEEFDGNKISERKPGVLASKQIHTITNHNMKKKQ
ncbi:MAG: hypothetical protein ACKPKO_56410, partial [Candidatus Fonsibacter sp.]